MHHHHHHYYLLYDNKNYEVRWDYLVNKYRKKEHRTLKNSYIQKSGKDGWIKGVFNEIGGRSGVCVVRGKKCFKKAQLAIENWGFE